MLQCAVASVEDNGFAMETGIPGVQVAFLNRKVSGPGKTSLLICFVMSSWIRLGQVTLCLVRLV